MRLVLKCILKRVKAGKVFPLECRLPFKQQSINILRHGYFNVFSIRKTSINYGKCHCIAFYVK